MGIKRRELAGEKNNGRDNPPTDVLFYRPSTEISPPSIPIISLCGNYRPDHSSNVLGMERHMFFEDDRELLGEDAVDEVYENIVSAAVE